MSRALTLSKAPRHQADIQDLKMQMRIWERVPRSYL